MSSKNIQTQGLIPGIDLFEIDLKNREKFKNIAFDEWKEVNDENVLILTVSNQKGSKIIPINNKFHDLIYSYDMIQKVTSPSNLNEEEKQLHQSRIDLINFIENEITNNTGWVKI